MNTKAYWFFRAKIKSLYFVIKKCIYKMNEVKDAIFLELSFQGRVFLTIILQTIKALFALVLVIKGDKWLLAKISGTAFCNDMFKDIVLGGMGIAGVILGLYCANIVSVFSAQYTNAPRSLVKSFQDDTVTNGCIKQIISYFVICILFLLSCISNVQIFWFSTVLFLVLTVRTVVTFSITGNRSYYLSDSFRIADKQHLRLLKTIKYISNQGLLSRDISFQNHFMKICSTDIQTLKDIAHYNMGIPSNQNQALLAFMIRNNTIISEYWKAKSSIYFNSYWYRDKAKHQQWHLASEIETKVAIDRGQLLSSKQERDKWWFEDTLFEVNQLCFDKLLRDNDTISIYQYVKSLGEVAKLAHKAEALDYWETSFDQTEKKLIQYLEEAVEADEEQLAALMESVCAVYAQVLIGISEYYKNLNVQNIYQVVKKIKKYAECNFSEFAFMNVPECERLFEHVKAEYILEHKRITPDWYIEQVVAYEIYKKQGKIIECIQKTIEKTSKIGYLFIEQKKTYIASVAYAYFFSLKTRCEDITSIISRLLPSLEEKYREKSIVWENFSLEGYHSSLRKIERELPKVLIKCCGSFAVTHWQHREKFPDFLGFCYNSFCERLIQSIENDDYSTFEVYYKDFFRVSTVYHEYVRSDVVKRKEAHLQSFVFSAAAAPLVEYATISGLAIIWGEFLEDVRWKNLVDQEVQSYLLQNPEDGKARIKHIIQIVQTRRKLTFAISERGWLKTKWEQRISRAMVQNKKYSIVYRDYFSGELDTNSKILKAYLRATDPDFARLRDAEDVYFVISVNPHLECEQRYTSRFGWEARLDETN